MNLIYSKGCLLTSLMSVSMYHYLQVNDCLEMQQTNVVIVEY